MHRYTVTSHKLATPSQIQAANGQYKATMYQAISYLLILLGVTVTVMANAEECAGGSEC